MVSDFLEHGFAPVMLTNERILETPPISQLPLEWTMATSHHPHA